MKKKTSILKALLLNLHNQIDNFDLIIIIREIKINFNLDNNKILNIINNRFTIDNFINLIIRLSLIKSIQMFILINNNKVMINTINNQILNIKFVNFKHC